MSKESQNKTKFDSFSGKLRSMDLFGEEFRFNLPNGKKTEESMVGCCATIFAIIIITIYGVI